MPINHDHTLTKYFFFRGYRNRIKKYLPEIESKEILEIGAGYGHFLKAAIAAKATVDVIEPRRDCHHALNSIGARSIQISTLESASPPKHYDICVAITVLDEVEDKATFLREMRARIKETGTVLIEVRNTKYLHYIPKKSVPTDISMTEYLDLFRTSGLEVKFVGGAPRPLSFGDTKVFIKTLLSNMIHYILPMHEKQMLIFVLQPNKK